MNVQKFILPVFAFLFPILANAQELTINQAMSTIFGHYDTEKKRSLWQQISPPSEIKLQFLESKKGYVSAELFKKYQEEGKEKYFLITKTIPTGEEYPCHACAPLLSAIVFVKNNNRWEIESKNLYLGEIGQWAKAPTSKLIQVGQNKYGILLTSASSSQGYSQKVVQLILPINHSIKEAFRQTTYESNLGACANKDFLDLPNCWENKSTLQFKKRTGTDYFDIVVENTGTAEFKGKIISVGNDRVYRFEKGEYRLFEKKPN